MPKKEDIEIRITGVVGHREIAPDQMDNMRGQKKSQRSIKPITNQKTYDEEYLDSLIEKATPRWQGVDTDKWLGEFRGDYE